MIGLQRHKTVLKGLLEQIETMERNGLKNWLFNNDKIDDWMLWNPEEMEKSRTPRGLSDRS
jgi:hypothetical protein